MVERSIGKRKVEGDSVSVEIEEVSNQKLIVDPNLIKFERDDLFLVDPKYDH